MNFTVLFFGVIETILGKQRFQPTLCRFDVHTGAFCIIRNLILSDSGNTEIPRLWMRIIPTAHRRCWGHCQTLSERDTSVLCSIQQFKQHPFLIMVRACRISGCWTDSAIFLGNQSIVIQRLIVSVGPKRCADVLCIRSAKASANRSANAFAIILL